MEVECARILVTVGQLLVRKVDRTLSGIKVKPGSSGRKAPVPGRATKRRTVSLQQKWDCHVDFLVANLRASVREAQVFLFSREDC
jgi:hypothetical protein